MNFYKHQPTIKMLLQKFQEIRFQFPLLILNVQVETKMVKKLQNLAITYIYKHTKKNNSYNWRKKLIPRKHLF